MANPDLYDEYEDPSARLILITGSYGKTNCRDLIGRILKAAGYTSFCADHIEQLSQLPDKTDFALLSLPFPLLKSLRECKIQPDLVLITNVSSYPLYPYKRYRELLEEIDAFLLSLGRQTVYICNREYRFLERSLERDMQTMKTLQFWAKGKLEEGVWATPEGEICLAANGQMTPLFREEELLLQGERNIGIYLAAAAATCMYADAEQIREACLAFSGHPAHFCCYKRDRGVRLYMQLTTGLPSLAEAAFVGFKRRLTIVTGYLGKAPEDLPYQGYALMLSAYAKRLILFGADRELIAYAVKKVGISKAADLPIDFTETGREALSYACNSAAAEEWIIFVPLDYIPGVSYEPKGGLQV